MRTAPGTFMNMRTSESRNQYTPSPPVSRRPHYLSPRTTRRRPVLERDLFRLSGSSLYTEITRHARTGSTVLPGSGRAGAGDRQGQDGHQRARSTSMSIVCLRTCYPAPPTRFDVRLRGPRLRIHNPRRDGVRSGRGHAHRHMYVYCVSRLVAY